MWIHNAPRPRRHVDRVRVRCCCRRGHSQPAASRIAGHGVIAPQLHPELLGIKRLGALLILHEDAHGTNVRDHILTFFSCICQFAQGSKIQDADLLPIVFEDAARGPLLQFPTHHERLQRSRASEGGEREREITQRAPIAAK